MLPTQISGHHTWYVDTVGKVCNVFTSDPSQELSLLSEDDNIVTLQQLIMNTEGGERQSEDTNLKVTDIEVSPGHSDVTGLPHVVRTVKPAQELPVLQDDEDGRRHGVHGN